MEKTIILDGMPVSYDLQYKKIKRINLRVHRDGSVHVSASKLVPQRLIDAFLMENGAFILRTQDHFRRMREAGDGMSAGKKREYTDGCRIYMKGEPYLLRIVPGAKESVQVQEYAENEGTDLPQKLLVLTQKDAANGARRQRMLNDYFRKRCLEDIERHCKALYPEFERLGVAWPEIRVRSMVSRWGSCHPSKGVLTFALQLLEVPDSCMEYVVMHEFAHFIHPNHSPAFHEFLDRAMPDWKARMELLNRREWVLQAPPL